MRPGDIAFANTIEAQIIDFSNNVIQLPGVSRIANLKCLVEQIIDSIRRIKYVTTIRAKAWSPIYSDPTSHLFDPLKAAAWNIHQNNIDEAFWLVFLATHFGRSRKSQWTLAKEVYLGNGRGQYWDWQSVCNNFPAFQVWLTQNQTRIKALGSFSNHRKYQSISSSSATGTGAAVDSYIRWVRGSHVNLINTMIATVGNNPEQGFEYLYRSMQSVVSFGRIGKFDYLTMIGKLGLANILPGNPYLINATGPLVGAKLLFGGSTNASIGASTLNNYTTQLGNYLNLYFVMQVLEDSICNWQKSPSTYVYFTG